MVDIRTHSGNHVRKTRSFRRVGDDLSAFDTGVVVLVNEKWFDDDEDLVDVGTDEVIKLVQDSVNKLDKQVPFLVFEGSFMSRGKILLNNGPAPNSRALSVICRRAVFALAVSRF